MAWNDPQWGNKGGGNKNSGPPDLDEMWRRVNERLNGMFGDRSEKPDGESPTGLPDGGNLLGLLVGVLALIWLASGFYIVDTGQRGMVLRFGQYVETTEPGPRWHFP